MLAVVVVLAVLAELAVLAVPGVAYADMNRDRCAKRRARAWRSRASRSLAIQVRKYQKKFSGSKKNRPPGDPPGGPKSLLEAKKSLLEMKNRASDAFWRSMIDF